MTAAHSLSSPSLSGLIISTRNGITIKNPMIRTIVASGRHLVHKTSRQSLAISVHLWETFTADHAPRGSVPALCVLESLPLNANFQSRKR